MQQLNKNDICCNLLEKGKWSLIHFGQKSCNDNFKEDLLTMCRIVRTGVMAMHYDRNNLINLVVGDLENYPCPQCNLGSFTFNDLNYILGGPIIVDVCCSKCRNVQKIKFHVNVV